MLIFHHHKFLNKKFTICKRNRQHIQLFLRQFKKLWPDYPKAAHNRPNETYGEVFCSPGSPLCVLIKPYKSKWASSLIHNYRFQSVRQTQVLEKISLINLLIAYKSETQGLCVKFWTEFDHLIGALRLVFGRVLDSELPFVSPLNLSTVGDSYASSATIRIRIYCRCSYSKIRKPS